MALTEEDLSAILQPSPPSHGLMSMSLANAMLNTSSAMDAGRDIFSAQLPFSPLQRAHSMGGQAAVMNMNMSMQRGVERSNGMSSMGSLGSGSSVSSMSEWPAFSADEKWELDGKNEVLDSATMRGGPNFGAQAQPLQPLNQVARTQGLQRYHSAPSSFLQCLADFGEEDFAHITNPLGDSRDEHLNYFNENLAPIMESAPSRFANKQPEPSEKLVARSNPMNSTEQYFAIQAENARQSTALRASSAVAASSEVSMKARAEDASGFRARILKTSLLRQSSSPAELLAAIKQRDDDPNATMQQIRSHDDSSTRKAMAPLFSNPTYVFNDAMTGGGGVWKMPTSPAGNVAGKRVRFPEEMTDNSSELLLGDDAAAPTNIRGGRTGSLMRHQSLPTTSTTVPLGDGPNLSMDVGYDDLLDLYAPCKTRARRGYATHPRSIAERNRRSRISERMKKLQDLVPNMDKQTNTADMLDEAVEYVKHLQLQVKDLSETIVRLKNSLRQQNTAG